MSRYDFKPIDFREVDAFGWCVVQYVDGATLWWAGDDDVPAFRWTDEWQSRVVFSDRRKALSVMYDLRVKGARALLQRIRRK